MENTLEDISILMAIYNHEKTVSEAIDSVLMQEMPYKFKLHCFNDASTDKSGEIVNNYASQYPDQIKVYTSPTNQGLGKKSFMYHRPPITSRYWCLLAGDDFWTNPNKLAKQVSFLNDNRDYVGCSCNTLMKNEITGEKTPLVPYSNTWNIMDLLLKRHNFYVHPSSVVWRNIFLDKGFFLPPAFQKKSVYGDVVLTHAMLSRGGKMHNIPEIMSCYRYTGKGIWSKLSPRKQYMINHYLVPKMIIKSIPYKYIFFALIQKIGLYLNPLKKLAPRPINE